MAVDEPIVRGWPFRYAATLTRGVAGGDLAVRVQPGLESEFAVTAARVVNRDTVSREAIIQQIQSDGTVRFVFVTEATLGASSALVFPATGDSTGQIRQPHPSHTVWGEDMIELRVNAVAAGEDASFDLALRVFGQRPTVTTVNA